MTDHLSFLDNVELIEVQPNAMRNSSKTNSNPVDADIRVFRNGKIYPSLALITEFDLEYQAEGNTESQNGFDLINSADWAMLPTGVPQFLAIAVVSKLEARKPHLFGRGRNNDKGQPVHSVADQGSVASGKLLIEYLQEVLTFEFAEGKDYVDLNIDREHLIVSPNGVYQLPRKQMKGEKAGELQLIYRKDCNIYPLVFVTEESTTTSIEAPLKEIVGVDLQEEESAIEE